MTEAIRTNPYTVKFYNAMLAMLFKVTKEPDAEPTADELLDALEACLRHFPEMQATLETKLGVQDMVKQYNHWNRDDVRKGMDQCFVEAILYILYDTLEAKVKECQDVPYGRLRLAPQEAEKQA